MDAIRDVEFETVPYAEVQRGDRVKIARMCNGTFVEWWWKTLTVDYVKWLRDDRAALMLYLTEPLPCGDRFVLIAGRSKVEAGVHRLVRPTEPTRFEAEQEKSMPEQMPSERLAAIENSLAAGQAPSVEDVRELLAEAKRAREDSDHQYAEADYWRESYRLVKGLSDDEINAVAAVRDASKAHPRPCEFPHEACRCEDKP